MKSIEPYMKLGWHTVPLKGKLERLADGKKTIPKFEEGWRDKYTKEKNTVKAKLGGTITGEVSGIIAIDCDNETTYNMFKSLDPSIEFEFVSQGKGYPAGTLIYKFTEDFPHSFSINDGDIALDVYSNGGFIYLATEANPTKVTLDKLPALTELPATTLLMLKQLHALKNKPATATKTHSAVTSTNCLAPIIEQFVGSKEYSSALFKIITPRDFRTERSYIDNGHMHPNDVPEGRGSEYMSKLGSILGADISVSLDLFVAAMHTINDMFDDPIDTTRFDKTILDPIMSGRASVDGKSIWQYDENWKAQRLVLPTKRKTNLELGFDDNRNMYYTVDILSERVKSFNRDSDLVAYIESASVNPPNRKEVKTKLPIVNVVSDPAMSFGFSSSDSDYVRSLNTFAPTPELSILHNPIDYKHNYKKPEAILNYFGSLVPDEQMRSYLLSFIKRKLGKFEYSPVVLYFLGVHGSGKDTFVEILERIIGNIARPTVKEFLELNNAWMLDTYFVQLDEYGDQLTRRSDKEEAQGKLKAYTGKSTIQIRRMRTDGFSYKHSATFIQTANKNPFGLQDGDRRIALMPTPNKLETQQWVKDLGGISPAHDKIMEEIPDFCYYLATQVEMLDASAFVSPPESEAKLALIADSMYAAQRIAFAIKNDMKDYLLYQCKILNADSMRAALKNNDVKEENMEELYLAMTDMQGDIQSLNAVLRTAGVIITKCGHTYKYEIFKDED